MRLLSLFSGIEAISVATSEFPVEVVAFSEIEPFPCSLLKHRYPEVMNLGDVTKVTQTTIRKLGRIDIIVFGSPCQDLSIAGKREGLSGERSGLFKSAIRIVRWARKHNGCRYALWENVPGAFSSNSGEDFREVLRLFSGAKFPVKKWRNSGVVFSNECQIEWRVLDAQHFGVPQRRRRVFALADFGDWANRPSILFESGSMRRDSEASGKERATTAARAGEGTAFDFQAIGQYGSGKVGSTLSARDFKDSKDLVVSATGPTTHALTARHDGSEDGSGRGTPIIHSSDTAPAMTSSGPPYSRTGNQRVEAEALVATPTQVRRLTPTECERLQGFPDGWTDIPHRGKPAADAPRYKALGNSMAVPVVKWILERILIAELLS